MKKLRLDIDALQVESFAPAANEAPVRGTVNGRQELQPAALTNDISGCYICPQTQATCLISCDGSCYNTCFCPVSQLATDCTCPIDTQICPIDTRYCPQTGICPIGTEIC